MRPIHLLPLAALLLAVGCSTHRYVASTFPNGKPEVVIHYQGKGDSAIKVKEEVYHANGKLDYVGRFKDGKEHGVWNYYYEDGTPKFTEHWENGLEEGLQVDFAPDGKVYRELYYEKGKLVRTVEHAK